MAIAMKWILFSLGAISALVSGYISASKESSNTDKAILSITSVAFGIACIGYSLYMSFWWGIAIAAINFIVASVLGAFLFTISEKARKAAEPRPYQKRKGASYHDHTHHSKKKKKH